MFAGFGGRAGLVLAVLLVFVLIGSGGIPMPGAQAIGIVDKPTAGWPRPGRLAAAPDRPAPEDKGSATGTYFATYGGSETAALRSTLRSKGVQAVRVYVEWVELEATEAQNAGADLPSTSKLGNYDERLADLKAKGVKAIVMIGRAPSWAAARERGPLRSGKEAAFARFLTKLVTRWSASAYDVHHWELWPEPDFGDYLDPKLPASYAERRAWGDNGADYATMLRSAYPAIKAADPTATVIMGSMAHDFFRDNNVKAGDNNSSPGFNGGGPFVYHFLTDVIDAGGAAYFDWVAFNAYSVLATEWDRDQARCDPHWSIPRDIRIWYNSACDVAAKAKHIRARLAAKGVTKPLAVLEAGMPSCCPTNGLGFHLYTKPDWTTGEFTPDAATQAAYMARLYARGIAANLKVLAWWLIEDFEAKTVEANPDNHRGWYYQDLSPKPAARVMEILTSRLTGTTFNRDYTPRTLSGKVEGYIFTRTDGQEIVMMWSPYGPTETAVVEVDVNAIRPFGRMLRDVAIYDAFGAAVTTTYLGGETYRLTVGYMPVYIEVRTGSPLPTATVAPASTVVPATGGTLRAAGGSGTLTIDVPSGAVGSSTSLDFVPLPLPTATAGAYPIAAFSLLANGGATTTFNEDIVITFRYDGATLGSVNERTLKLYIRRSNGTLEELPSTVDTVLRTITARTRHFTEFELSGSTLPEPTPRATAAPDALKAYLPVAPRRHGPP